MRVKSTCFSCGKSFMRPHYWVAKRPTCSQTCRLIGFPAPAPIYGEDGATASIPLVTPDGVVQGYVLVDAVDAEWVSQWRWARNDDGYAVRREKRREIKLHRALLGLVPGDGMEGDHINRVRSDHRRCNLRALPKGKNAQNMSADSTSSSQLRGVCLRKDNKKWMAYIRVGGKLKHLGLFATEEAAGAVAREARMRLMPYAVD